MFAKNAAFVLVALFLGTSAVSCQIIYKLCTSSRFEDQCSQLQRGNSEVNCQRVQDSIDCAQRIMNGTADFGVFTAESALQLANLRWSELTVIKELRHVDRQQAVVDFESVVVVKADHQNGIDGLRGLSFCHPGLFYDRTQRWTERFLKHFERTVVPVNCTTDGTSPAEIETTAMANFFGASCRPGAWSNNIVEDAQLKKKFPQLCSLCNAESNCSYTNSATGSRHQDALHCLRASGQVAYVSLEDAQNFFLRDYRDAAIEYAYLCPNGTKQSILDNSTPCTWLSQPWKLVISNNIRAVELSSKMNVWMRAQGNSWESSLREVITTDSYNVIDATIQQPRDYFRPYRMVPVALSLCSTQSIWCTTSPEEKDKCEVIRAGGVTTGVYPIIECREPTSSVVGCLSDISAGRADLAGIDSNYGYMARHPYNLTAAMYAETEYDKYSSVVVVIKASSTVERFEQLRNSKACFAEFSGIASVAFINTGKNRGFFNKKECNYGTLLSDFFGSSCAPGAREFDHDHANITNPESLCTLCRTATSSPTDTFVPHVADDAEVTGEMPDDSTGPVEVVAPQQADAINCNADHTNRFFGNKGALKCLSEEGDVAIVELQYLKEHAANLSLNQHDFRIICHNGSLADRTGFEVDIDCALTTIVDGEIVVRRNSDKTAGIINALASFDQYFLTEPDFKMYNNFAGNKNLLFKDSTIGLVSPGESNLGQSVREYIKLFENLDQCVDSSATSTTISAVLALVVMLSLMFTLN